MTTGTILWLVVFLVSAVVFFGLASVIAVKGFKDLISLLSKSEQNDPS